MQTIFYFLDEIQLKIEVGFVYYLNVSDTLCLKGRVERSHGRNKATDHVGITPMKNLATNKDVVDSGLRMKRLDVGDDPLASRIHVPERSNVAVGRRDSNTDAGAGESLEDLRVHIEDLDAVDGGPCLEEVGHGGRWREVVAEGAVVDSDGVDGGGDVEEQEEEEEEG